VLLARSPEAGSWNLQDSNLSRSYGMKSYENKVAWAGSRFQRCD
jgi:hypothetical protein